MAFVKNLNQIIGNLERLEDALTGDDKTLAKQAAELVRDGEAFVVYKVEGVNHFAPSGYCSVQDNSLKKHAERKEFDQKDADKAVAKVVGKEAFANNTIDSKYMSYCQSIGIKAAKTERIFWRLYEGGSYLEL